MPISNIYEAQPTATCDVSLFSDFDPLLVLKVRWFYERRNPMSGFEVQSSHVNAVSKVYQITCHAETKNSPDWCEEKLIRTWDMRPSSFQ